MTRTSRLVITLLVAVAISLAAAADLDAIEQSVRPLRGAVEGIGSGASSMLHLPGYGVHISTSSYASADDIDRDELIEQLTAVVVSLGGMVEGLDEGDVVSVSYYAFGVMTPSNMIVVRMRPGEPDTLEVFVDSVRLE